MKVVKGKKEWELPLKAMWAEAFLDSGDAVQLFFQMLYREDRVRCVEAEGKLVSAIHEIDAQLWLDDFGVERQALIYLYAGATWNSCRGKGYYGELMRYFKTHWEEGIPVLVPATGLYPYYERLGFYEMFHAEEFVFLREECKTGPERALFAILDKNLEAGRYQTMRQLLLGKAGFVEWGKPYLNYVLESTRRAGGDALRIKIQDEEALFLGAPDKGCLNILETTCSREQLRACGKGLLEYFGCEKMCRKEITLMSPWRDWPREVYFRLPSE